MSSTSVVPADDPRTHTFTQTKHYPHPSTTYAVEFESTGINLSSAMLGAKILYVNDDFFASVHNLLQPTLPVWDANAFTVNGKWMDGWESRRKRDLANRNHDYCIIQLCTRGVLLGVDVDTANFTGNYPDHVMIEGVDMTGQEVDIEKMKYDNSNPKGKTGDVQWTTLLTKKSLQGGSHNYFVIRSEKPYTHLRVHIFPDGGVARLRMYGIPIVSRNEIVTRLKEPSYKFDLLSLMYGGRVITCSNAFFGPKDNLILPTRATCMGEGWETKRKRVQGNDWIIVAVAVPGHITEIEIDTNHFKGNFPDMCSVDVTDWGLHENSSSEYLTRSYDELLPYDFQNPPESLKWTPLFTPVKTQEHYQHYIKCDSKNALNGRPVTYVRLNVFPDGGVSRLRAFGVPA